MAFRKAARPLPRCADEYRATVASALRRSFRQGSNSEGSHSLPHLLLLVSESMSGPTNEVAQVGEAQHSPS